MIRDATGGAQTLVQSFYMRTVYSNQKVPETKKVSS